MPVDCDNYVPNFIAKMLFKGAPPLPRSCRQFAFLNLFKAIPLLQIVKRDKENKGGSVRQKKYLHAAVIIS